MSLDSTGKPNPYVKAAPKKLPSNEKEKAVSLKPKDAVSVSGEIPMHELMNAQKKIDQNNAKAGIAKDPLTRPRSKQQLPIANK